MNNPIISVVVPVYNTGEYLDECVKSLLAQTYRDFEIILINDGSTDGSGDLCDSFAKEYPTLVKVFHQENAGISAAYNAGIMAASGEWIMFVDHDDWVEDDMLEMMIKEAETAKCDVCISGCFLEYPKHSVRREFSKLSGYQLSDTDKLILIKHSMNTRKVGNFNEEILISAPWAKLYRKKVIDEGNITFVADVKIVADLLFNFNVFEQSTKTIFMKGAYYHHRRHSLQSTNKYQADMFENMERYLQEFLVFLERFYHNEDQHQIYHIQVVAALLFSINLVYRAPNTPHSLKQRILGIKAAVNREPYKEAICNVSNHFFTRNRQIQIFFLRHMPVPFYYFGMRAVDLLRGRK